MIPLGTITLPPLTWTGFCAGVVVTIIVVIALGWHWDKKQQKEVAALLFKNPGGSGSNVGIPFENIEGLYPREKPS